MNSVATQLNFEDYDEYELRQEVLIDRLENFARSIHISRLEILVKVAEGLARV